MIGEHDAAADDAGANLRGPEEATGVVPNHSRVGEPEGASAPADERAASWAVLRPHVHEALEAGLADLSDAELRALASHPDPLAALVLAVGLAARAGVPDPDPVVTQVEAAALLAELGVTHAAVQHLIIEDVLPARPRRSDVLGVSVGEVLAARRAVGASRDTGEERRAEGSAMPPR